METYRHSGKFSMLGIVLASCVGCVSAIVLGVVYSFAIVYIPFVYLNFLITCIFGFVLGGIIGWCARIGKIRDNFIVTAYSFVMSCIGLYFAWGADLIARLGFDLGFHSFEPTVIYKYIVWFYENGTWGIGHGVGNQGQVNNITGIFLLIIWLAEAGLVIGITIGTARKILSSRPFCEYCNQWTGIEKGVRKLSLQGADEALKRLLTGDLTSLGDFTRSVGEAAYLQLDLAACSTCSQSNFLTLQTIQHEVDKEGKTTVNKKTILQHLILEPHEVPMVRDAGKDPPAIAEPEALKQAE
jgi:hypothetical protein